MRQRSRSGRQEELGGGEVREEVGVVEAVHGVAIPVALARARIRCAHQRLGGVDAGKEVRCRNGR